MTHFNTRKEAEDAKPATRKSLGFCPIIRGECRIDCLCYAERSIYKAAADKFYLYPDYCNHVLVSGYVAIKNN